MPLTTEQLRGLSNAKVVTDRGDKVGTVGQFYLDDQTGAPEWVTVKTGLFGGSASFAPLQGARLDGQDLVVAYDKDTIKAAPRIDDDGSLTPDEEDTLYRHYGLSSTSGQLDTTPAPVATDRRPQRDVSGGTADTDDAMTRSEEQVRVGTQTREASRVRLRKYIETEQVSQTVRVSHDEARVVHEPITPENYDRSVDGPEITEAVHEVTLQEDVPVVDKKVVPVERVRLDTETVTEQQTVSADVRKEQIETERGTTDTTNKPRR